MYGVHINCFHGVVVRYEWNCMFQVVSGQIALEFAVNMHSLQRIDPDIIKRKFPQDFPKHSHVNIFTFLALLQLRFSLYSL